MKMMYKNAPMKRSPRNYQGSPSARSSNKSKLIIVERIEDKKQIYLPEHLSKV